MREFIISITEWVMIVLLLPIWLPMMLFKGPRERFIANYKAIRKEDKRNKAMK